MLRRVLTGTILGLVLFVLGSGGMDLLLERQASQYQDLIDLYFPLEEKVDEMHLLLLQQQAIVENLPRGEGVSAAEIREASERFGEALSAAFIVSLSMLDEAGARGSLDLAGLRSELEPIQAAFEEHSRRLSAFFDILGEISEPEMRRSLRELTRGALALQESVARFEETLGHAYKRALARASAVRSSVRKLFVLLVGTAAVLGALANVYFYRSLLPLRSMVEAVRKVAAGSYEVQVSDTAGDEVGYLAGEFNAMTRALGEQRRAIEESHREKLHLDRLVRQSEKLSAVGELSLGIAHEVRNPLSTIQMTLDALGERGNLSRIESERISLALQEVDRLEGLVSSLLDYGRPSAPRIGAVEVEALIEHGIDLVQAECSRHDVRVAVEAVDPGLPELRVDENQILQVLVNLLLNAVQASPAGGRVRVTAGLGSPQDPSVEIRVADRGSGIDPEELKRIFTPFFTTRTDGTGLGLPVARKIAETHGGSLVVESEPGRGTTALLRLPVRSPAGDERG